MDEKILKLLKEQKKALTIFEIEELLGLKNEMPLEELTKILYGLEENALIYHTNKDKYMLLEDSHLKKGIMHANKRGFGFVDVDNEVEDVYIAKENVNGALHGDHVLVEVTSKKNIDRQEGRILRVLKRSSNRFVGEIHFQNDVGVVKLDDEKILMEVIVSKENTMHAVDGHKVVVEIIKRLSNHQSEGKVIDIIGHKNDPGVDILSIVYQYDIPTEFSEEVKEEVRKIPDVVLESEYQGRTDLREEEIFTIDGDDTKDIDDAISLKETKDGYELGVHIADVSYYVKEGTALNEEAMERGTSVYLVDRVIPMLPHELSNGICSLNPGVDRLTISCVMQYDREGKMISYDIFPSVIRSRKQMTYRCVNQILEKNEIPSGYENFASTLKKMYTFSQILRKVRTTRGAIDFDIDEAKILVDENCVPQEVVLRNRGAGEKLIEDFMIAANECVASHIFYMNLPFIYRIHENPKEEKIRDFLSFVSTLGYHIDGNVKDTHPKTIQRILNQLQDKKEYKILATLMLRSMQKAIYSPQNLGHFGLASRCYTHFTSPIRRYPDTTVHRLLHTYLFDKNMSSHTLHQNEEKLIYIADHSSSRERASVDCERAVEDMKMAEYMESHIGEEFEGMISSVMSFGMFVELDNLIEGLVPIRDMDDFFHYDEERMTLTGEKSHIEYRIGERVIVKVVRASKEEKQIDFEIVKKV